MIVGKICSILLVKVIHIMTGGIAMIVKQIAGFALDCKNPNTLVDFYNKLLGWDKIETNSNDFSALRSSQGWVFAFQRVPEYIAPVWPWTNDKQQQMGHFDYYVEDLEQAVNIAIDLGATKSEIQYFESSTVMFDPEGHPFCLTTVLE